MTRRDRMVRAVGRSLIFLACLRLPSSMRKTHQSEWLAEIDWILKIEADRWWAYRAAAVVSFALDNHRGVVGLGGLSVWRTVVALIVFSLFLASPATPLYVYATFTYLRSGGDAGRINNAKNTMFYAQFLALPLVAFVFAGVVLLAIPTVLLGLAILNFIIPFSGYLLLRLSTRRWGSTNFFWAGVV